MAGGLGLGLGFSPWPLPLDSPSWPPGCLGNVLFSPFQGPTLSPLLQGATLTSCAPILHCGHTGVTALAEDSVPPAKPHAPHPATQKVRALVPARLVSGQRGGCVRLLRLFEGWGLEGQAARWVERAKPEDGGMDRRTDDGCLTRTGKHREGLGDGQTEAQQWEWSAAGGCLGDAQMGCLGAQLLSGAQVGLALGRRVVPPWGPGQRAAEGSRGGQGKVASVSPPPASVELGGLGDPPASTFPRPALVNGAVGQGY